MGTGLLAKVNWDTVETTALASTIVLVVGGTWRAAWKLLTWDRLKRVAQPTNRQRIFYVFWEMISCATIIYNGWAIHFFHNWIVTVVSWSGLGLILITRIGVTLGRSVTPIIVLVGITFESDVDARRRKLTQFFRHDLALLSWYLALTASAYWVAFYYILFR